MNVRSTVTEYHCLPLTRFHYDKAERTLTAEASDFGPCREGWWWLQRLYVDACDMGIAIRSHHTGKVEVFVLEEEQSSGDGDLLAWVFVPLNKQLGTVVKVIIFND